MPEAFIIDACRTPRGIGKPGMGAGIGRGHSSWVLAQRAGMGVMLNP